MKSLSLVAGIAVMTLASTETKAATCTIGTIVPPNFGSYDVMATGALDTTGTVQFTCSLGLFVTMTLSKGNGTFANRAMLNGASVLNYNLYLDAGHSFIWGDGTSGTLVAGPSLISVATTTVTVYAHLPARQNVPIGPYGDSITITLNF